MKKKTIATLVLGLSVLGMTSCGGNRVAREISEGPEFIEKTFLDFTAGTPSAITPSDGWCNGGPFGVTWKANNVKFDETNGCQMSVTKEGDEFYGAELKTTTENFDFFHYGYFGTWMKPSNEVGTASTFFTYTGEVDENPHDEIDIEFLGKDTTKVQFNWFCNGTGGHEHLYNLGFDASKEFHQYGFLWTEEKITWYVDFKPVYETNYDIPKTPQRIFQNFWKGNSSDVGIMNWMGRIDESKLPFYCYSKSISYATLEGKGLENVPEPVKPKSIDDIPVLNENLQWNGNEVYRIAPLLDGKGVNISYEGVTQDYSNISASLPEASKTANTFAMSIKNNGTESATVRLDLNLDAPLNEGGIMAANDKAYYGDGTEVRTDKEWGGSFFDIPAGETRDCVVEYYGPATSVMAMIDSTREGTHSGNLVFSNYRLGGENAYVPPVNPDPQPQPGEGSDLTVSFQSTEDYTVTNANDEFDVVYSNVVGNSYKNIVSSLVATELDGQDSIFLHIENKGEASVLVRVDLNAVSGSDRVCVNSKAVASGDLSGVRTDLDYGGSYATVAAGGEGDFRVYFGSVPSELMIFIDSAQYNDSNSHSGHVVFSDFLAMATPVTAE